MNKAELMKKRIGPFLLKHALLAGLIGQKNMELLGTKAI